MTRRPAGRLVRERRDDAGYLLDTHIWVWMVGGEEGRLGSATRALLLQAAGNGALYLSDVSCWEVALKHASGRYRLSLPLDQWLDLAVQVPGMTMLPLERRILLLGAGLTAMHGDPADRCLVATAKLHGLTLITADQAILGFAREEGMTMVRDGRG